MITSASEFHVMLKPAGPICNLSCTYCYYVTKESLYPNSDFHMSDELIAEFTHQYIEAQQVPEITFGWQGGEPLLMGLDFFRRAIELQDHCRPTDMRVINTIQTNGVPLDSEWCHFFQEHDFLVGLSLDGPREMHDAYRVDKGSNPSFDRVMAGIELLKEYDVKFNILTTVHKANTDYPLEVYRFLRDEVGTQFIQFIPIVQLSNGSGIQESKQVTQLSVTGQQYGDFLIAIFDEWVRRDVGHVFVQIFDTALAAWSGQRPGLCIFEETCGLALVMEHNGDLYACDHFVEPSYKLGNIQEIPLIDMVGSEQQLQFGLDKRGTLPRYCRECEVRFICNGGCPKNRTLRAPDGESGLNYLCAGYKAFFTHIDKSMRIMAAELRARRSPANVMLYLAEKEASLQLNFTRAHRNDPCPCGSGRKFKYCHGK